MRNRDYLIKIRNLPNNPCYKSVTRDPTTCLEKTRKATFNKLLMDATGYNKHLISHEKSSRDSMSALLLKFQDHLNSFHQRIQFNMKSEDKKKFALLDIDISRSPESRLIHTVYERFDRYNRIPSHTTIHPTSSQ